LASLDSTLMPFAQSAASGFALLLTEPKSDFEPARSSIDMFLRAPHARNRRQSVEDRLDGPQRRSRCRSFSAHRNAADEIAFFIIEYPWAPAHLRTSRAATLVSTPSNNVRPRPLLHLLRQRRSTR